MSESKPKTLYIEGMHCAACESLIEHKLNNYPQISNIKASLSSQRVTYESPSELNLQQLNNDFKDTGYIFSKSPTPTKVLFPLLLAIAAFAAGFFIIPHLPFANTTNITPTSPILNFLVLGVVAGFSTCAALTGGLLLSVSQTWKNKSATTPYLLFNGSRLVSFILLGALLGLIGGTIAFNPTIFTTITIAITVLMLIIGLQMLNLPYVAKLVPKIPNSYTTKLQSLSQKAGSITPTVVGALTFIVPCGFTILAQTAAMGTASPLQGALIMGAFALGTLPALVLMSTSSAYAARNIKIAPVFNRVIGALLIAFSASTLYNQSSVILPPSRAVQVQGVSTATSNDQVKIIQMNATTYGYSPKKFTVEQGQKVRWEIYNSGASGCTNAIQAPGLVDGYLQLKEGLNTFEFTPQQKGTFKFTCWMGMVPPGTITVQ